MSLDVQPTPFPHDSFYFDVIRGLSETPPRIPAKYLYDDRGSRLFNQICRLPEYYPTRLETELTRRFAPDIAAQLGSRARLIELGAGSGMKTRYLLDELHDLSAYIPVDISTSELTRCAQNLRRRYPDLDISPICADYTADWSLPHTAFAQRTTFYYSGSTIGNFTPDEARRFLQRLSTLAGPGGRLVIGVDLQKEASIVEAAYNDGAGVTAAFNLNLLRRLNRELNADFDRKCFRHEAIYDKEHHRIEMRLVSTCAQRVNFPTETYYFEEGDFIVTEHSHKFTIEQFATLSEEANWRVRSIWSDDEQFFSLWLLETPTPH